MNLKDYIRGQRQGKEANQLERKAMDDPFLQDAIDGYDSMEGDHISMIEDLENRFSSPKKRINKQRWIWAATAAIILLIGIPLLLHKPYMEEDTAVASSDATPQKKEEEAPLLKDDTLLLADHHALNKREDTAPEARQTPSPALPAKTSLEMTKVKVTVNEETKAANVMEENVIEEIESVQDKEILQEKMFLKEPQPDKITVSGRILDETGEPLPGATIHLLNSSSGTISDTAGNFQLIVPQEGQGTLLASYIGMKTTPVPLKENAGDIMMKADDRALNEVVIVGYGIQKKERLTGSVSTIKERPVFGSKEFKEYFAGNYDKNICREQNITIVVEFFIDSVGRPSQINIKKNSCPALENEIKRLLLGSPHWTEINKKVTLQLDLP